MITRHRMNELIKQAEDRRVDLRTQKGMEYTRGEADVLSNFRRIGKQLEGIEMTKETAPMVVWFVYFHKHFDALVSFIKTSKQFSDEPLEGRIDDMQVYLDLFRGFVEEIKVANGKDKTSKEGE